MKIKWECYQYQKLLFSNNDGNRWWNNNVWISDHIFQSCAKDDNNAQDKALKNYYEYAIVMIPR